MPAPHSCAWFVEYCACERGWEIIAYFSTLLRQTGTCAYGVETKDVQPPANIMNKLADALGTSVDYLISGDKNEKAKASLKNSKLIQRFKEVGNQTLNLTPPAPVNAPSIEAAKKIADALEVSLNNLVGEGVYKAFDKKTLQRFKELEHLEEEKKKTLFDLIDTYIREAKARKAYA